MMALSDEADWLSKSPLEVEPPRLAGQQLRQPGTAARDDAFAALRTEGLLHIHQLISAEAAASLKAEVEEVLRDSRAAVLSGEDPLKHFAEVLTPSAGHRQDLKLELSPVVRAVLQEAVEAVAPLLGALLGADAVLWELAALSSEPGAVRQEVTIATIVPHRYLLSRAFSSSPLTQRTRRSTGAS